MRESDSLFVEFDDPGVCSITSISNVHAGFVSNYARMYGLQWSIDRHIDYDGQMSLLIETDSDTTFVVSRHDGAIRLSRFDGETYHLDLERFESIQAVTTAVLAASARSPMCARHGVNDVA